MMWFKKLKFMLSNVGYTNQSKGNTTAKGGSVAKVARDNVHIDSHNTTNNTYNMYFCAGEEFDKLKTPEGFSDLLNHGVLAKNRYDNLRFNWVVNSVDMEEDIKNIYKSCYELCLPNLQDNKKYRLVKNLIDIVPKLTGDDIAMFKKITHHLIEGNSFVSVKTQKLSGVYYYVNDRSASQNYLVQMETYGLIKFGVKNLDHISNIMKQNRAFQSIQSSFYDPESYYILTNEGKVLFHILTAESGCNISEENITQVINEMDEF